MAMNPQPEERKDELTYRLDPITVIFRELDLIHSSIKEIKDEIFYLHEKIDNINRRMDAKLEEVNRRMDAKLEEVNRRMDTKFEEVNRRMDAMYKELNRRIDDLAMHMNKRLDRLFIVVIINLFGLLGFLGKIILDALK